MSLILISHSINCRYTSKSSVVSNLATYPRSLESKEYQPMKDEYEPYKEVKETDFNVQFGLASSVSIVVAFFLDFGLDFFLVDLTPASDKLLYEVLRRQTHRVNMQTEAVNLAIYFGFFFFILLILYRIIRSSINASWTYSNALNLQFLSKLEQFRPKKKEQLFDSIVFEWLAVGNELQSMMERDKKVTDLAKMVGEREALRRDLSILVPIYEKEKSKAVDKTNAEWIGYFNRLIEYITRMQVQLERDLSTDTITTTKNTERLSIFNGEYAITNTGQKAVAVTLRLDEQGEFEIYRRDGKSRQYLKTISAGEMVSIELSPPAESGRLEIVRKEDGEFDTISLP